MQVVCCTKHVTNPFEVVTIRDHGPRCSEMELHPTTNFPLSAGAPDFRERVICDQVEAAQRNEPVRKASDLLAAILRVALQARPRMGLV